MNFLEKDLEQIIFETSNDVLNKKGLPIYGKKLRQVKIGNYGIADLITIERPELIKELNCFNTEEGYPDEFKVTLYELKLKQVNKDTAIQAFRYLKGIKRYLAQRYSNVKFRFNIVLIGQSIDLCYLLDFLSNMDVFDFTFTLYSYKLDINGLSFEEFDHSIILKDEGFEIKEKPLPKWIAIKNGQITHE